MKELTKYLNLNEDATPEAILSAVKEINDKLTEATTNLEAKTTELTEANSTIEDQKKEITTFKDSQTKLNETLVDETLDTAVEDGKLDEKDKEEVKEQFKNNLVGLKMLLSKQKTPAAIISDKLKGDGGDTDIPEDRKDWNLRKWEKEDAVGLEKIRNNSSELYAKMWKAQYGKELETA